MFQVLRQLLVELILSEVEVSGTLDWLSHVLCAFVDDLLTQSSCLDNFAYVVEVDFNFKSSLFGDFFDGLDLAIVEDLVRDWREENDAKYDD